ncbi:MAG: hypothetical protein K2Y28_02450 [Burkholderiaceae bacterium]|nr:hypothetical protein [Burkholderiaceae bacterium]
MCDKKYIYHVTPTDWFNDWFANGTNRLGFKLYQTPGHKKPSANHAPLNEALLQFPGLSVFSCFFFEFEEEAMSLCFELLNYRPHAILRVDAGDSCFFKISSAPDDRDLTRGAHIRFLVDNSEPEKVGEYLLHSTAGIPFSSLEILTEKNGEWAALTDFKEFHQSYRIDLSPDHQYFPYTNFSRCYPRDPSFQVIEVDTRKFFSYFDNSIPPAEKWSNERLEKVRRDVQPRSIKNGVYKMPYASIRFETKIIYPCALFCLLGLFGKEKNAPVISFTNGRHRARYLQYAGAKSFPIEVHADHVESMKQYCGK